VPERINAAHRLDQVLTEAAGLNESMNTMEGWARACGIYENNPQAGNLQALAVEVAHMVGLLREQTEEVYSNMRGTQVRTQQYESAIRNILNALDISNLNNHWGAYRQYLIPETLVVLRWCADTLPCEEEVIDPEDLEELDREAGELGANVEASDLPDYVKSFVLEQVSIIKRVIRDYPIIGAQAFRRGCVESLVKPRRESGHLR
jgi:hypothetical protein